MAKKRDIPGFDATYEAFYGARWPALRDALRKGTNPICRWSRFAPHPPPPEWKPVYPWAPQCFPLAGSGTAKGAPLDYVMDLASVVAASALPIEPDDTILDLCAAPGGKTLILAESLRGSGLLIANELSANRRARLTQTIRDYLPDGIRANVVVRGRDGGLWGKREPSSVDKVLVDAPCSSEKHVLAKPAQLAKWTPSRSKILARRQYGLLRSATLALKPGGLALYATCSVSPLENDAVVARLIEKRGDEVEVLPITPPIGAPGTHGHWILPDETGCGPLYFSLLRRR